MKRNKSSSPQARPSVRGTLELTDQQRREISKLETMPDEEIDTSDIPELGPKFWKNAVVGRFYRQ